MVPSTLSDFGCHDQSRFTLHCKLPVVALLVTGGRLHDPAFWVGEVVLLFIHRIFGIPPATTGLTVWNRRRLFFAAVRPILRLLTRPQTLDGFLDLAQTLLATL